ncbi:hypothetical protein [Streptomyces sp. CA-106110]|uniref:hypothetical protein n=1 Tax=Streptomyces sp. CA-106110 TaxID=3240044 RepID=UPI003D939428
MASATQVHHPRQATDVGAADAGAIRGDKAQSERMGRAREAVHGQPGVGQPVAEQHRGRGRLPTTSTAITPPPARRNSTLTSSPATLIRAA